MTEPSPTDFDRLAELRQEDFQPHLGREFSCSELESGFRLQEVVDLGREPHHPQLRRPFSLLFCHREALPQRIYPLHREELGCLPIFLVPVGTAEEASLYEAVFQ